MPARGVAMKTILAADISGTNSRFAHFQIDENDSLVLKNTIWLETAEAGSFTELMEQLNDSEFSLSTDKADMAVIAVAGPVQHETYCDPPYISWDIDLAAKEIKKVFQQASLLNDFAAQAYACRSPVGKEADEILAGEVDEDGAIGVIGGGTALGKATLLTLSEYGYHAMASEGGHAYFPFVSQREFAFQKFYREKSGQRDITGNLVVSGRGLQHIHWFLTGEKMEPKEVAARFTPDSETLAWVAKFYGRACRDFALEVLALGGLYVAGGVAAKNPQILVHEDFAKEFVRSSTMEHILKKIPVFLVDNQDSGLWGAAFYGQQLLRKR